MKCRLCADARRKTLSEDVDLCDACARILAREILDGTHRFVASSPSRHDGHAWLDLAVEYAEKGLGPDAREAAAQAIVHSAEAEVVIGALAAIAHATDAHALEAILKRARAKARDPLS